MYIQDCNLSKHEQPLIDLTNRIQQVAGIDSLVPALPFSPVTGIEDAGWSLVDGDRWTAYTWLRRHTEKRAILDFGFDRAEDNKHYMSNLWNKVLDQASQWELENLICFSHEGDNSRSNFLLEKGFTQKGHSFELQLEENINLEVPEIDDQYFLKSFAEFNHAPSLAALLHRGHHQQFARPEHEHSAVTSELLRRDIEQSDDPDAAKGIFMLIDFLGKGIAEIRTRGINWMDAPGIVEEERKSDFHILLVKVAVNYLRKRGGKRLVMLAHDEDPNWISDYETQGFILKNKYEVFHKRLLNT